MIARVLKEVRSTHFRSPDSLKGFPVCKYSNESYGEVPIKLSLKRSPATPPTAALGCIANET